MAAGTIPISMTQQLDVYAQPLAGGQLYIIQAGTVSTPQDAFQDVALTIKQPYPMTLDAAGRVPQFFLDNSVNATVKIRLQDKNGVVQLAADNVLIIGPAGGTGGGGTTVDPSTIYQTGDIKPRYGVGVHPGATPGWVRMNGLTIGSSTSGASMPEGARPECLALFQYLWNTDPNLAVTPTRGASASSDWTANKQIATPDWRGYALGALDDMGNSAVGRYGGWFPNATTLGAVAGVGGVTLTAANLPAHNHSGNTGTESATHNHNITGPQSTTTGAIVNNSASAEFWTGPVNPTIITGAENETHYHSFTTDNGAGLNGVGFAAFGPRKLCTFYLKL